MSILDPDQNKVTDQLSEDMIRYRIREYCTRTRSNRYWTGWEAADKYLNITNVDKDEKGWYIDTECVGTRVCVILNSREKTLLKYADRWCENNPHKGFLIRDHNGPDTYFRWRKHKGILTIFQAECFESTEGLPEELDALYISNSCHESKGFFVHNQIDTIVIASPTDISISGSGYKRVIIYPYPYNCSSITTSLDVDIYRPQTFGEYMDLQQELIGY